MQNELPVAAYFAFSSLGFWAKECYNVCNILLEERGLWDI
jgi:hypothetical protein